MSAILDNTVPDKDEGIIDKIKDFKKKHAIGFWVIVGVIVAVIAIIISTIIGVIISRKNKSGGSSEEKFMASNNINNEFDYVNSYISSTLGDSTAMDGIIKNSTETA